MNRRTFLARIFGVVAVAVVAPAVLALPAPTPPSLAFRCDAFDREIGIAVRFVKQFDHTADALRYHRLDVIYGIAAPSRLACQVAG